MAEDIKDALGTDAKTNKASEDTEKSSDKAKKGKEVPGLTEDILSQLLMTGENTSGMFAPDEKELEDELSSDETLHEEQDEKAKLGKIKDTETKDEYKKAMAKDIQKHPDRYSIMTPQGRMSVTEAIKKGFNPETGQFEKSLDEKNEEALSQLNDQDRAAVEQFMNPAQVGLAPADADSFGLDPSSPLRKPQAMPMQQEMPQQGMPAMPPEAAAMPGQAAVPAQGLPQGGGNDILSMLGGLK